MKKFLWVALACMVFAVPSFGQLLPSADVSAGYSYFREGGSGGVNLNGFHASAAINANAWLGFVADLGVYHGSPSGVSTTTTTYLFGPRLSLHLPLATPFVEGLVGGAHASASAGGVSASSNPLGYGFGGGFDVGRGVIALRPQVDYIGLRVNGQTTNCVRISASVVFRIGSK